MAYTEYSKKENSYRISHSPHIYCVLFSSFLILYDIAVASRFFFLSAAVAAATAAFFSHFVGSYADSDEIERRSQYRVAEHIQRTKSQSPIFAEHFRLNP